MDWFFMWLIESNFQWSVQSNAGLISFALLGFVFGLENSRLFSQPIRFKTKNQARLGYSRFPALQAVYLFHSQFSFSSLYFLSYD